MDADRLTVERVVDRVWSEALDGIVKGVSRAGRRPGLGDDVDLFVPQSLTGSLLTSNPGFANVLYSSGYVSAKRNAYFIIRRLGMPPISFGSSTTGASSTPLPRWAG